MHGSDIGNYRAHKVEREDRPDGTILLRSGWPMGRVARCTTDWLRDWARETPDAVLLAERSGAGWREVTYAQALGMVEAIAAALLDRGLGADTPIAILSGNSVNHGLLTLAAQHVGIPTMPLAEQYALMPGAHRTLLHCIGLVRPGMVYAEDGQTYAEALALPEIARLDRVVTRGAGVGLVPFDDLLKGGRADVDAANATVGPDTLAKILMTSGSTSLPKGVQTTQRMMCANQTQIADALPFLRARPPRIVDWLPWNHVFGGSHNFNMMLANGGALYVDAGKPVPPLVKTSLENLALTTGTIAFNVPVGFAQVLAAMREDADLKRRYFEDLDMLFYAGASLPQEVWAALEDMAREVRGDVPLFTSSWGLTETAPACLIQHVPAKGAGIVGVPMTGVTVKLVPDAADDSRYEVRVAGPNITPGYVNDPKKTAEAFDEEGYFITGDAMSFIDPDDMTKGLRFEGRIAEEFKLASGTWVKAGAMRLDWLGRLGGLAQDVVLCGAERMEVGLMIVPSARALAEHPTEAADGALLGESLHGAIRARLAEQTETGASRRVARVLVLADPPSIAAGEATAKGNLNFRKLLSNRAALLARLYDDADPAVIRP